MNEFLQALAEHSFLQMAAGAALLASLGCGLIGPYVVARRISFTAGGIAHAALGGVGLALYLGADPTLGALLAAWAGALLVGWIHLRKREGEDLLINALWAVGMGVGILTISALPPGEAPLMGYLFGNVLLVSGADLARMAAMDAVLLLAVLGWRRQLMMVCLDEDFARVRGVPVAFFYLLLLSMVALTVVLLVQLVGMVLVLVLLSLPAATARHHAPTLGAMTAIAILLGAALSLGGLALAYQADLEVGPVIVLLAAAVYLASTLAVNLRRRLQPALARRP